jgi:hypothetical protein
MKTLTLLLRTPEGDELGRLPLTEVAVAVAGEAGARDGSRREEEMPRLYRQIREAVARERMELALDPIDACITISRALLLGEDPEEICIPLPVRETRAGRDDAAIADGAQEEDSPLELDGLFDLNEAEEGEHPDA